MPLLLLSCQDLPEVLQTLLFLVDLVLEGLQLIGTLNYPVRYDLYRLLDRHHAVAGVGTLQDALRTNRIVLAVEAEVDRFLSVLGTARLLFGLWRSGDRQLDRHRSRLEVDR